MRGPVATLLAALFFGIAGQQLFFARAAGVNVLVATALFLALGWSLRPRERRPELADRWLPVAALAFAALCVIRADAALVSFNVAVAAALAVAWIAALGGARVTRLDARALGWEVADGIAGMIVRPARIARAASGPIAEQVRSRTGRLPRYASGAALACPFLIVFSILFASADPVYARRLNDLVDVVRWRELFRDAVPRLLLFILIAWLAAAALSKLARPPLLHPTAGSPGMIAVETAAVLLACVDLLFAAFVVFQVGYLFGGRDTIDAAGLPYSAYARRGFFELIACASLVGALLFGLGLQRGARSRATTTLGLLLVALTIVVLVSAWYRLDLYQLAYGWTELRFYALAAIVFLALVLLILGWCIVAKQMRYALQPVVGAALLVGLGVNVLSPSTFVARADLQRLIDPSVLPSDAERRMDPAYLVSLGDGAYPVLVELLPSLPPPDQDLLRAWLRTTARARAGGQDAWEGFNVDRARAHDALESAH
ncbi:MAG TPA: DUF4173 domain-containing protein [Candidatus Limnocylindria bacterium]|nr:DUF4173 domain-containing protein [Candidatus Limnocylindria bacterium]